MKRLPLLAAIFLVNLVGMVGISGAEGNAIQTVITQVQNMQMAVHALPATANTGVQGKPKMYYLTKGQVSGDQATDACSTDFHMASIFEILDTSNLQYATGLPDAFSDIVSTDDQRDGPAVIDFGWVRTGYESTVANAGTIPDTSTADCNNWSAHSANTWGTIARLYDNKAASQMNSEWLGICARLCDQTYHVWCVQNR